jgi:tight adherence protein B
MTKLWVQIIVVVITCAVAAPVLGNRRRLTRRQATARLDLTARGPLVVPWIRGHRSPGLGARRQQRRRGARNADATDELASLIESIAGLLRTGLSLPVALDVSTRDAYGSHGVTASLRHALDRAPHIGLASALTEWSNRSDRATEQEPTAARALLIVNHGGPGAATALDGLAEGLRATLTVEREVIALSSQARLSGSVMALVPLGFAALLSGTDERARTFLLRSPIGIGCLVVGLTLDAVAWWWMRRLAVVEW